MFASLGHDQQKTTVPIILKIKVQLYNVNSCTIQVLKSSAVICDLSTILYQIAKTKQRNAHEKNIGKGNIAVCLSFSHCGKFYKLNY